jgi:hypothetical protein
MRQVIAVAGAVLALGFIPVLVPAPASALIDCSTQPAGGQALCEEGCKLSPEACVAPNSGQPYVPGKAGNGSQVPAYQEPSQNDPDNQGPPPAQAPPPADDPGAATGNPGVVPGNPVITSPYFAPAQPEGCDWYNVVCWWGKLWD